MGGIGLSFEMFIPGKAFFGAGVVSKVVELIGNGVKGVSGDG